MKKIIYKTIISSILILFFIILYLSTIGIKTNKFNSKIISQIKNVEPNIEIKINDVSAKLNLFTFTIDVKTVGPNLINKKKIIELENIKSKISLKSIINNQFALSGISISTKSIPIKDLISFIRLLNNDPKLFIAEQLIRKGYLVADIKLEFDEFGNIKNNYKFNGLVNDGQISLLKKKLKKLNFIFQITNKELKIDDIKFLLNNKNVIIPELTALKKDNEFLVSGKLDSRNLNLKKKDIKDFIDNEFLELNLKEITFSANSDFFFRITQNFKLKNFDIKSTINLDYLKLNNFLKLKNNFPNIKDEIIFENQKIQLNYDKDKMEIIGSGNIFLQEELDIIKYKIINDKKNFVFDTSLKISKNPFVISLLGYEKKEKSNLNLNIKGKSNKDYLYFKEILLTENENNLFIKDLKLTNKYKVNDIGNIKLDYVDKENLYNKLQIKKDKRNYKIIGNSLNINQIVTELLESDSNTKQNIFNKNFNFFFDIKKIYLDKDNTTNNLTGSIFINDNEINELNLESEFSSNQIIKFTIKTTDNDEKITTLFSSNAKPLVDRYKFIKGFNEGALDFYSIKKNNETKSTLKIYDFKLKELPALTKILTLASLQGIADILSGEGIRFDEFEMKFINKDNLMTINEIYAIGPAISILMEGYIEKKNLISLRGTLVPATTINKTIGSIPILGKILVGKKAGEGVFGVSFKIKGPPKNLETSVNPIKTLTPRFITRTLEKIKKN
jgi:hypothetical protein